jgi:hypothetical protein
MSSEELAECVTSEAMPNVDEIIRDHVTLAIDCRSNRRASARSSSSTPARSASTWPIVATSSSRRKNRKSGSNA